MRIAFFDTHVFEKPFFIKVNESFGNEIVFFDTRLDEKTGHLARQFDAVCAFVNDHLDGNTLRILNSLGVRLVALRSAGFNNVDLDVAADLGIPVVRVPEYSPFAVAEHAVALVLTLNRKTHRAFHRVRDGNFSLEGLVGFDLHEKTVGVVGTGRIGAVFAKIMLGFGCRVLAVDQTPNPELLREAGGVKGPAVEYVELETLLKDSHIISLHVPLTPQTHHLINGAAIEKMRHGVMIINTGRGALIDTPALVEGLKSGQVGYAGLDVYEEEEEFFFKDLSNQILKDDTLARLLTFPNVLLTSHQAFLTEEALLRIAETTLQNIADFASGKTLKNQVRAKTHRSPRL